MAVRARPRRRLDARRDVRPLIVGIVVAAGVALFYLSQSAHVAATGYQISSLEARLADERAIQQQLISAIGQARSPATITARARDELGLVQLEPAVVGFVSAPTGIPAWLTIDD